MAYYVQPGDYPFTFTYIDEDGVHKNAMYPGSRKPRTSLPKVNPDTDPVMGGSRVLSTIPQVVVGGAKNILWDLIGLPTDISIAAGSVASLLEDNKNLSLRALGLMGKDFAEYQQGGRDLWDAWGKDVDDALYGDRKVDAQGKEYRDGYNADGSMPVGQYILKGLGSVAGIPGAIAQGLRGYSPMQPIVDIWNPISPEIRRAMYTPTAELKYSHPIDSFNAFAEEASIDPRVATMSLGRLGSELVSDALALGSMGTGVVKGAVKGAKLATKATKTVAKDIKDGFTTDYSSRDAWGDVMGNALTGTTATPKNIQVPKGNLNTFKPVPKATMTNARFRDYNMRGE